MLDFLFYAFFELRAGQHHHPAAGFAAYPKVHPHAQDFPQETPAGMGFFHLDYIARAV